MQVVKAKSVGMCADRLQRVHDIMQAEIDSGSLAGVSTLIAREGKIVYCQQQGFQDRESQTPMSLNTLFRLYSMTKPIVATALMTLYERGLLDLREPVSQYIPSFAHLKVAQQDKNAKQQLVDLKQPMTIYQLLTHTSGLAYDVYDEYPVCQQYRDHHISSMARGVSLEQFVDNVAQLPLAFQPGEHYLYGVNIDIVARIIEIISKKPLDEFLQQVLFTPLAMHDTSFYVAEQKRDRVATMYGGIDLIAPHVSWATLMDYWQRRVNQRLDVSDTDPIDDPNFMRGGIGLKATIEDYYRFAQMLLNKGSANGHSILSPKTIAFMHMNHLTPSQLPLHFGNVDILGYGYGLGSRVHLGAGQSHLIGSAGEFGWSGAAKTYYWVDPKEQLIGIFMSQSMTNFSLITEVFKTLTYQAISEQLYDESTSLPNC